MENVPSECTDFFVTQLQIILVEKKSHFML